MSRSIIDAEVYDANQQGSTIDQFQTSIAEKLNSETQLIQYDSDDNNDEIVDPSQDNSLYLDNQLINVEDVIESENVKKESLHNLIELDTSLVDNDNYLKAHNVSDVTDDFSIEDDNNIVVIFPDYSGSKFHKPICLIQGLFRIRQAYDRVYERKVELGIIKIYTELEYYTAACILQGFYHIIVAKEWRRKRRIEYAQEQIDRLNQYHEDYLLDLMMARIQKNVRRWIIRK
jgi:hypothetical protein